MIASKIEQLTNDVFAGAHHMYQDAKSASDRLQTQLYLLRKNLPEILKVDDHISAMVTSTLTSLYTRLERSTDCKHALCMLDSLNAHVLELDSAIWDLESDIESINTDRRGTMEVD